MSLCTNQCEQVGVYHFYPSECADWHLSTHNVIIRRNGFDKLEIFITFSYNYHFMFCPYVQISTRYDLYVYHVLVPLVTGSWSVISSSGVYHFYQSKRANSQL